MLIVGLGLGLFQASAICRAPPEPPFCAEPPVILGNPVVGAVLQVSAGVWTGGFPLVFTHRWTLDGVEIPGATGSDTTATRPGILRCETTATNASGAATALSAGLRIAAVDEGRATLTTGAFAAAVAAAGGLHAGTDVVPHAPTPLDTGIIGDPLDPLAQVLLDVAHADPDAIAGASVSGGAATLTAGRPGNLVVTRSAQSQRGFVTVFHETVPALAPVALFADSAHLSRAPTAHPRDALSTEIEPISGLSRAWHRTTSGASLKTAALGLLSGARIVRVHSDGNTFSRVGIGSIPVAPGEAHRCAFHVRQAGNAANIAFWITFTGASPAGRLVLRWSDGGLAATGQQTTGATFSDIAWVDRSAELGPGWRRVEFTVTVLQAVFDLQPSPTMTVGLNGYESSTVNGVDVLTGAVARALPPASVTAQDGWETL